MTAPDADARAAHDLELVLAEGPATDVVARGERDALLMTSPVQLARRAAEPVTGA